MGGRGAGGGGGGAGGGGGGETKVNAESLRVANDKITDAGAHGLTKVSSAKYRRDNVSRVTGNPDKRTLYGKGKFAATNRIGSLDTLKKSVKKAGYKVKGSMSFGKQNVVVFD